MPNSVYFQIKEQVSVQSGWFNRLEHLTGSQMAGPRPLKRAFACTLI